MWLPSSWWYSCHFTIVVQCTYQICLLKYCFLFCQNPKRSSFQKYSTWKTSFEIIDLTKSYWPGKRPCRYPVYKCCLWVVTTLIIKHLRDLQYISDHTRGVQTHNNNTNTNTCNRFRGFFFFYFILLL